MEIRFLDQWACLLEPPGEAGGESQRTTVRSSAFIVDGQPQAPETHTPRGLHLCRELFVPNGIRDACWETGGWCPGIAGDKGSVGLRKYDFIGVSRPTRRCDENTCARPLADRHNIGVELSLRPRKRERDRMENRFLTSGLACWNRQVKRAERASGPP